jgi:orc1/cdc6 family replication initiation protein
MDYNFQDETNGNTKDENKEKIIEDTERLDLSYIPEQINHRDEQIREIAKNSFAPVANGRKGSDLLIVGPPGTGKTATVKHVKQKTEENNDRSKYEILYVNCSTNSSGKGLFTALCNSIGIEYKEGVELSHNINRFKNKIKENSDKSFLIVLDEIQELRNGRRSYLSKPVLYELTRPSEGTPDDNWSGSITLIGISNDPQVISYLDDDVKSSMDGPKVVEFPKYKKGEIAEILSRRQESAYTTPLLSGSALKKISEEVRNNFGGDIRKGIEILRKIPDNSPDVMKLLDDDEKQLEVVDEIIKEIQRDRIRQVIYSGKTSGKEDFYLVMASLYMQLYEDDAKLKHITEAYEEACEIAMREKKGDTFKARRSFVFRCLEKLVDAGLLEKSKAYQEKNKPNKYIADFDLDLFSKLIEDRLERHQLISPFKEANSSLLDTSSESEENLSEEEKDLLDAATN